MNAIQQAEELKAHSDEIRRIVRKQREAIRMTEKEVNDNFFNNMARRGLSAPKAIMTKVRDTRRDLILNRDEAECLAAAVGINPEPLYPIETAQAELPMATSGQTRPGSAVEVPAEEAQASAEAHDSPEVQTTPYRVETVVPAGGAARAEVARPTDSEPEQLTATTHQRAETEQGKKVSVGFYETPQGLRFLINKRLTQNQFDRLTLAIPEYMMTIEREDDRIYCRANVPIFDYQAELLTRAIFGGK